MNYLNEIFQQKKNFSKISDHSFQSTHKMSKKQILEGKMSKSKTKKGSLISHVVLIMSYLELLSVYPLWKNYSVLIIYVADLFR